MCNVWQMQEDVRGIQTLTPGPLSVPPPPQFIIVSSLLKVPQLTLFDYKYPDWSITVGYLIGFSSFMWIPIYMVYKLVWTPGSLKQVSVRKEGRRLEQVVTLVSPQRLAVCLRPERTIPELHADSLHMTTMPWWRLPCLVLLLLF